MNNKVAMRELHPLMKEMLQNGKEVIFTITGSSMMPMLSHQRDKVCIIKPTEALLNKYDIPLFMREDGKYILHRIVGIGQEGYVALGDNQCDKEYPVMASQVIGVVKGFWRKGKYISCDNFWYKVYCRVWAYSYPVRWMYLKGIQCLKKLERRWRDKNEG